MNAEEQFVAAAVRRMYRWMGVCAVAVTLAVLVWKGPWYGGGFAVGAALSILNFHWMKGGVDQLAAYFQPTTVPPSATAAVQPAGPARRPGRAAPVVKFVLRYALLIAVGYAIFRTSILSLTAFLAGLFVFVAGVLAEMIYELTTGTGAGTST